MTCRLNGHHRGPCNSRCNPAIPPRSGQRYEAGRAAYEEDCRRCPNYPFGAGGKRPTWDELPDYAQESWNRNPTPRRWDSQLTT